MEAPAAGTAPSAVIGADLGGTKLVAGLFDDAGTELARTRLSVAGLDQDGLVEGLAGAVETLRAQTELPVVAAGFGIPTTFDQRTGVAVQAANLPIADLPLRDILLERTGLPVFLDNDANVAALAEQRMGSGAGVTQDLIMVTLGTGFGGGIVSGGRIQRGAIGAGGELGHMSIAHDGPPCISPNCPGVGCIETFASGSALRREAAALLEREPDGAFAQAVAAGAPPRGETLWTTARAGDTACQEILEQLGRYLGVGLANLVNIFNPRIIAVGGGLTPALEFILPEAKRVVRERALAPGNEFTEIVVATFGPDAGMIGAALMARDGLVDASSHR